MKPSIRSKLILSHAAVVLVTVLFLGLAMNYFTEMHLEAFYERIKEHGPGFPQQPKEFQEMSLFIGALRQSLGIAILVTSFVAIAIGSLLSTYFINPINKVIDATRKIAKGKYKTRVHVDAENELGDLANALNHMAEELEANHQLKQELVANVSHELATPLTNITGYLEALRDGVIKGKKKQDETLELLHDETTRLTKMVADVRALSLVEAPSFKLKKSKESLHELVAAAIKKLKPQASEKSITIENKIPKEQTKLNLDKDRFLQVLINLLSNAIKYSPPKSTVHIKTKPAADSIKLSISDQGCGVLKKDLPYIFERFYRTDKSRGRDTGGTGVGLAIVKELVEAHDGTITAESTAGKGSTFTITLKK